MVRAAARGHAAPLALAPEPLPRLAAYNQVVCERTPLTSTGFERPSWLEAVAGGARAEGLRQTRAVGGGLGASSVCGILEAMQQPVKRFAVAQFRRTKMLTCCDAEHSMAIVLGL